MMTPSWTEKRRLEALWRGPHKSAKEAAEFVRSEFCDFVKKKFWIVLPYAAVQHMKRLRLSPLGAVPQRDRRPRLIVDLSFYGVNQETLPIAPSEAMQFGRALQRILQRILMADPRFGPLYLAKVDIADGFYRIALAPRDTLQLAVLLPQMIGEEPMVAIPLVLPMGWINSPPYFSAVTETAADVMNRRLHLAAQEQPHRLETLAIHPSSPTQLQPPAIAPHVATEPPVTAIHPPRYHRPIRYADIYVDDFMGLVQGDEVERLNAMRTILHVLDDVLRPLEPTDDPHRQEPASVKKLKKGDANWSTSKVILGWLINTVDKTIQLPPHRQERLKEILATIGRTQKRTTAKVWHRLLGELRSMSIGVPGAKGLFSTLQTAFATADNPLSHDGNRRLKLSPHIHAFLEDFRTLAEELQTRPTRIAELIPRTPTAIGSTDAAGKGFGGAAFISTTDGVQPVVWRAPVPKSIQRKLVSFTNPKGTVTNSDLELAASVLHHDVLVEVADLREHTVHTFHDNTPTKYWQRKGSATTLGPAASLLRIQSFHQRYYRYVPFHDFLAGLLNRMADEASRLFNLSDEELLSHFNSTYPQTKSWQLLRPRPKWLSVVTSALAKKPSDVASFKELRSVLMPTGNFGSSSAMSSTSTPFYSTTIPFHSFKSLPSATVLDPATPPVNPSDLARLRTPYARWARRWPAWGPRTSVKIRQAR